MIYAYMGDTDGKIHYHDSSNGGGRGFFTLQVHSNGEITAGALKHSFYYYHGWLLWAAWGLFGFIQILSNRYLKRFWWLHMWIHRVSGVVILVLTYVYCLLALKQNEWKIGNKYHEVAGFIVMIVTAVIVIGGVFTRSMMNRLRWKTSKIIAIKLTH